MDFLLVSLCLFKHIKGIYALLDGWLGTPLIFRKVTSYVSCILIFAASTWLQGEK